MPGLEVFVPKPPLSHFVAFFWYGESQKTEWSRERLLPTGTVELVIPLSGPNSKPVLCGPHNQPFFLEKQYPASVIAVHFRPGGAFPFLRVPPEELRNAVLLLEDLWGSKASALRDRLLEAHSLVDRFLILESALLEAARRPLERRREVRFALREFLHPEATVGRVVEQIGYSRRHFFDMFTEEVGLTPKAYARVRRFQRTIETVRLQREVDWSEMALSCGYFDQAHFANDFREFSGLTPTQYLAIRTPHMNHVPVLE